MLRHVLAIGNRESSRKCSFGSGSNPEGGSDVSPVANIKTSSIDTAAWPSVKNVEDVFQIQFYIVFSQVVVKIKIYKLVMCLSRMFRSYELILYMTRE